LRLPPISTLFPYTTLFRSLEDERFELRRQDARLREEAERADKAELETLRERLRVSEERQRELQAAVDNISVRQVPVYEHRRYLRSEEHTSELQSRSDLVCR